MIQSVTAPLATVKLPARSKPIETGASPFWIEVVQRHCASRFQTRPTINVSTAVGPKNASKTTTAPAKPATHSPIGTTIIIFGPGAICPTLYR